MIVNENFECNFEVSEMGPCNLATVFVKVLSNNTGGGGGGGGGGAKVSGHTLGLITPSCFILEGCCFADGILYLLVRGFRRQNLKIRPHPFNIKTPILLALNMLNA